MSLFVIFWVDLMSGAAGFGVTFGEVVGIETEIGEKKADVSCFMIEITTTKIYTILCVGSVRCG